MLYSLKAVALAFFVACASAAATSEAEYQAAFTSWMQKHSKSYSSEEFQSKYIVFKANYDYVNQWNAANEKTKLDTNFLADLTNEEYQRIYLGTKFDGSARLASAAAPKPKLLGAPSSVNWADKGAVTPIKNQAQCGSCWSFSTTGSVEGIHFIKTGNLVSCSEQQLVDCSGSYGNQGCNGGLMDNAFKYIIAVGGLDSESSYPYHATGGKCEFKKKNVVATITGYEDIPSGDENSLTQAIVQQPISVAIDASHQSFQLYSSGVYYEPDCSTSQLDHGVLAVGYASSGSDAYYIVKNSWGAQWGAEGFIWMSRDKSNNCGIATMASYPTA